MMNNRSIKKAFEYIENECKEFDLSLDTPSHKIEEYYVSLTGQDDDFEKTIQDKREYLYNYLQSLIEKLILPILSLPRQTTLTSSPKVSTSSTCSILSLEILEM